MRSVLLFIVIVSAGMSSACKKTKSSAESGRNLPGTWKLKETRISPGYEVPWSAYEGPARYITFRADGKLEADPAAVWGNYDRYFVQDDKGLYLINSSTSDSAWFGYEQMGYIFTLYPQCFEGCGLRFKRVF